MWKILLWLLGSCRVRITGGSPAWAVSRLSAARILLRDVTPIDDFTIEARILTRDAARTDAACTRAMCTMEILETSGASRTFSGMCAEVVVRERPEREPVLDRKTPQNVVASRAGVITEVLCFDGNCLVSPGQAVESGQLLVSAYTDLEFKTQVSAARAEIYAKTVRHTETVLPETALQKRPSGTRRQLSLLLGNRRICLWGGGNSGSNCDKSTERRFFALPGGYFLPVGLEIVTIFSYDTYETEADADAVSE